MTLKAIRQSYGEALLELGGQNSEVVVLDDDLYTANFVHLFKDKYPERFFEIGIAEQNLVGVAAGLADMGKIPFATAFATFLTKRAAEPLSVSVVYSGMNVKLVGHQVGVTAGPNGPTHMAIEDIAYTRAQPGLVIVEAADPIEMHRMTFAIAEYEGPVYMRVGRDDRPFIYDESHQITIGKAVQVRDGGDLTIIASGIEVWMALEAAELLEKESIRARVIDMHTIKPLDTEAVLRAARDTGAIVTAENHNINGGLGSAVAEVLVENLPTPMRRVGLRDVFAESGPIPGLLEKYGMATADIAQAARDVLKAREALARR